MERGTGWGNGRDEAPYCCIDAPAVVWRDIHGALLWRYGSRSGRRPKCALCAAPSSGSRRRSRASGGHRDWRLRRKNSDASGEQHRSTCRLPAHPDLLIQFGATVTYDRLALPLHRRVGDRWTGRLCRCLRRQHVAPGRCDRWGCMETACWGSSTRPLA